MNDDHKSTNSRSKPSTRIFFYKILRCQQRQVLAWFLDFCSVYSSSTCYVTRTSTRLQDYLLAAALENSLGSIEYVMQFEASVTRDAEIVCKLCLILRLKMNGVVLLSTEAELYVQALQAFDIREIGSAR